jgi:DNA-binding SARP family transcriptional activator
VLELRLLGPLEALADGRPVPLGGTKPRALLTALVLECGRIVPTDRLIDVVWHDDPPESARALIQTYVSTLRHAFGRAGVADVIVRRSPGYLVPTGTAVIDLDVFCRLMEQARAATRAGDRQSAARLYGDALGMWRGGALVGMERSVLAGEARRLDELRHAATEERIAAELAIGRLDHVAELTELVAEHPTRERLRGQLMVTLYRLGRQADAVACFSEGRRLLRDELGIDPGEDLADLHRAILRGELESAQEAHTAPAHAGPAAIADLKPATLPGVPPDFTGRGEETAELAESLAAGNVQVIAGPGGIGKSVLAMSAAHQALPQFADGQLYAELRGMTDAPAEPIEVLGRFLRALGADDRTIPDSIEGRVDLYRSLLAGRRMLVVLDDARSESQVRPLLPGRAGCAVLVTSRGRLSGLAGARHLDLGVMTPDDAREFLSRIAGPERVGTDRSASDRIIQSCGCLPLAIRIAGAKLGARRALPVSWLADRLSNERERLDELSLTDVDVRASIGLSYETLPADPRRALRMIGFLGAPLIPVWVVAWLLAIPVPAAHQVAEALVDAQVLEFVGLGTAGYARYRIHDLVRLYAQERAEREDDAGRSRAAVERVLRGWIALFRRATDPEPPAETAWRLPNPDPPALPPGLVEGLRAESQRWFDEELDTLVLGVERAATAGLHRAAYELVAAQPSENRPFRQRMIGSALDACRGAADPHGEAVMLAELGRLRSDEDRYAEARQCYNEALSRFRKLRDVTGQAVSLIGLGMSCREPGHLPEAMHFLGQAAALFDGLSDDCGTGHARRLLASVRVEQGAFPDALADLRMSLRAYEAAGSRKGRAFSLRTLGLYHRARGEYADALRCFTESAELFAELGDELMRSYAVRGIAKSQLRLGHGRQALPHLEWALSVATEAGDRWGQAATLHVLGEAHLDAGRLDLADSCLHSAVAIWDALRIRPWRARTQRVMALVRRARGDRRGADALSASAWQVLHDHGNREAREFTPQTGAGKVLYVD